MLTIDELHVSYGAIRALKGVHLHVGAGELVALLGSNGAGKSTLLNCITGRVPAHGGSIVFCEQNIRGKPPHEIVKLGLALVPEGREVFPALTVERNLWLGAYTVRKKQDIERAFQKVYALFPILKERERQYAGTLSGGEQQMLVLGRALMSSPQMLLLDEPSLGLAPTLITVIYDFIQKINRSGVSILLVEQNANIALRVSGRSYVLETGNIVLSGASKELSGNDAVRKAYLGGS
ncbi:MAG: ABC transporter ATP-binding protein [Desulfovibrio sp.]|nr:ABC transporter ATP-binding protein [Desulfovibrio sp.]